MKKIYILFLVSIGFMACDPDDPEFQDVDQSQITDFFNEISGPSAAFASGEPENIYNFSVMPRSGSTYEWSVTGNTGATITPDPEYPFQAGIVFGQSGETKPGSVVVKETTSWGATKTFEMPITLKAFCPFDLNTLAGTYVQDAAGDIGESEITTDPNDQLLGLIINNMLEPWCGDAGGSIKVKYNDCNKTITFPNPGADQKIAGISSLCGYSGPFLRPPDLNDDGVKSIDGTYDPVTKTFSFYATVRVDAGSFGTYKFTFTKKP